MTLLTLKTPCRRLLTSKSTNKKKHKLKKFCYLNECKPKHNMAKNPKHLLLKYKLEPWTINLNRSNKSLGILTSPLIQLIGIILVKSKEPYFSHPINKLTNMLIE